MIIGFFVFLAFALCNSFALTGNYTSDFFGDGFQCLGNGTQLTSLFNKFSFIYNGTTDTLYIGYSCSVYDNLCSCLSVLLFNHTLGTLVIRIPEDGELGVYRVNSTQINSYEELEIVYGKKIWNVTTRREYVSSSGNVYSITNFSLLQPPKDIDNNYVLSISIFSTRCLNSSLSVNIWPFPQKGRNLIIIFIIIHKI